MSKILQPELSAKQESTSILLLSLRLYTGYPSQLASSTKLQCWCTKPSMTKLQHTSKTCLFHMCQAVNYDLVELVFSRNRVSEQNNMVPELLVSAPRLWNTLPVELRTCATLLSFTSRLMTYLFTKYYS